jgi:PAS domain S-box-containing protein
MSNAENEKLYFDLCENARDLIQSVSPEGRFIYVNRAWRKTLGYGKEEIDSLKVFDIVDPESQPHCMQVFRELMEKGEVPAFDTVLLAKDGRRIHVEASASCRFEEGRPVSTRTSFRDITQRKQVEQELNRLFELSLDLLCVAGTDGYFKHTNPAFEQVLGYSREELLSRAFFEFVHPEDQPGTLRAVEQLSQGLPVVDFLNRYRTKDGGYRWLAWRSAPVPEQGLIYAIARDVTEEKRLQEVMARQSEELERSNAELDQFASVASHDLRAPLRAIRNLSEWIEEDMPQELPEKVLENLSRLGAQVRRMERLTDNLLRYARAGRESSESSLVDTAKLIGDLAALLSPHGGIKIVCSTEMPVFETARQPLEQVFRNLISNAIKYHDQREGTILVSSRECGSQFEFSVRDDGPGIRSQDHDKIFEMFQKLESREDVEGTGMGLALVKRIVEHYGGEVSVEAAEPRGAIFRFTWPCQGEVPK